MKKNKRVYKLKTTLDYLMWDEHSISEIVKDIANGLTLLRQSQSIRKLELNSANYKTMRSQFVIAATEFLEYMEARTNADMPEDMRAIKETIENAVSGIRHHNRIGDPLPDETLTGLVDNLKPDMLPEIFSYLDWSALMAIQRLCKGKKRKYIREAANDILEERRGW